MSPKNCNKYKFINSSFYYLLWKIWRVELLARKGKIIFQVGNFRVRRSSVSYIINDFLDEKRNELSIRSLKEVDRLRENFDRIERSFLYKRIRPYASSFAVQ